MLDLGIMGTLLAVARVKMMAMVAMMMMIKKMTVAMMKKGTSELKLNLASLTARVFPVESGVYLGWIIVMPIISDHGCNQYDD